MHSILGVLCVTAAAWHVIDLGRHSDLAMSIHKSEGLVPVNDKGASNIDHAPMLRAADLHELRLADETANMIIKAEKKLRASIMRTESRCSHYGWIILTWTPKTGRPGSTSTRALTAA